MAESENLQHRVFFMEGIYTKTTVLEIGRRVTTPSQGPGPLREPVGRWLWDVKVDYDYDITEDNDNPHPDTPGHGFRANAPPTQAGTGVAAVGSSRQSGLPHHRQFPQCLIPIYRGAGGPRYYPKVPFFQRFLITHTHDFRTLNYQVKIG